MADIFKQSAFNFEDKKTMNGIPLNWNASKQEPEEVIKSDVPYKYAVTLGELMNRVSQEEPPNLIYPGIRKNSIGFIAGQAKAGKTTFAENLLQNIAAGSYEFLGAPIDVDNRKVLFYSMEEPYYMKCIRNTRQIKRLIAKHGSEVLKNYVTNDDRMPKFIDILNNKDWELLKDFILEVNPSIAVLDSLTHMYSGSIEESSAAKAIMERINALATETQTTLAIIHHTYKLKGGGISMDSIAGSRVLMQEAEFMIGFNRTLSGTYYMKDLAFRYAPCDPENARTFTIDEDNCITLSGIVEERELISMADGRSDNTNRDKILNLLNDEAEKGVIKISTKQLSDTFVATKEMSKQTLHDNLNKLVAVNKLIKIGNGEYQLAA